MPLNLDSARKHLQAFEFQKLFIEDLGWSHYPGPKKPLEHDGNSFTLSPIAELSGVAVFEVAAPDGDVPDARTRLAIHRDVSKQHHENLLVFLNRDHTASNWYWVKRDGSKLRPRDHWYFKGQSGDLILSKLSGMVFDLAEFDADGNVAILQVTRRLSAALDIEPVTKKFYGEFKDLHVEFVEMIHGIEDESDRKWYASVLLHRLMFIYFLQKKHLLNLRDAAYLENKLDESRARGADRYYSEFLQALFFEGFAKPNPSPKARKLIGDVGYLNGGLFLEHVLETRYKGRIRIPDQAFSNLLGLFKRYSWHLDDRPGGADDEINPDVLGYIFEKYINQKQFGAYYTRTEITEYLCERTIHALVVQRLNERLGRRFESIEEVLAHADRDVCRALLLPGGVLASLSILDPACGSGAFLVAAMKTLINIYSALIGRIEFFHDRELDAWLADLRRHRSLAYEVKKRIITDNLYGVDIMEEAVEICRLRLFLALVAAIESPGQIEPLPNIDFNVLSGNSLVGMLRVEDSSLGLFTTPERYRAALREKNELIDQFRHAFRSADPGDIQLLRETIERRIAPLRAGLDEILHHQFGELRIYFEEAVAEKKYKKRDLRLDDIQALKPFHWGFEFDQIIQGRGGFDAIITNPPWEILKPNAKEFFEEYSDLVTRKKMTIKDFEKEQARLLEDPDIRKAWLAYLSGYPHRSAFFRSAPQYKNQISLVDGKKAGTDINLYKLFTEQCFNLLRKGGYCGIVIPSGIYTDLGTKQLREMLFSQSKVTGLFCFENRKFIFEGVDCRFKFIVLSYEKGGKTRDFPAAFMRHHVGELERFPQEGAIAISVDLVRRLSPNSLSVMEFKNETDIAIAEKMLKFPLLGETIPGTWNVSLTCEFHMTNDSHLFKTEPGKGRLPLFEGKMIWQFDHRLTEPRYWVVEKEGRAAILGRTADKGQLLDYQAYRLGFRDIAANTNERTLVSSIIPPAFHGNKIPTVCVYDGQGKRMIESASQVYLCAVWNSFVMDYVIRMRVTTTLNFFYVYQLPIPRLTEADAAFRPIVKRAARLICTTPEFDDLAKEVGLKNHKEGATDPAERAQLRAELDGLIAHLFGLTEDEFAHILATFPLVADPVKIAALNAFRNVEKGLIQ